MPSPLLLPGSQLCPDPIMTASVLFPSAVIAASCSNELSFGYKFETLSPGWITSSEALQALRLLRALQLKLTSSDDASTDHFTRMRRRNDLTLNKVIGFLDAS